MDVKAVFLLVVRIRYVAVIMVDIRIMDDESKRDKAYDYTGCLYPEGIITSKQTALFDHSQIEKVFFLGYSDDEEKKFKKAMIEELNKMLQQQQSQS